MGPVTSLANVRGVADIAEIEGLIRTALPGSEVSVEDLAGGDHLYAHVRAPQFTGLPLIEHLGLDPEDTGDRKKIGAILKTWFANGVLATEERKDSKRRKKQFVVPGPWNEVEP